MEKKTCALIILAALTAATVVFPIYVRLFVDVFATGYSDVKLYAFPVFSLLLYAFYFSKPGDQVRLSQARFWIPLAILLAGSLLSYVYMSAAWMGGYDHPYRVVRDGYFSSNRLEHVHSFKPVVGWPFEFFPQANYYLDYGYPFMGYIPFYAYIPLSLVLLYLIYQSMRLACQVGRSADSSLAVFFCLAVGLFTVLKVTVDGGLMSYPIISGLVVVALIFSQSWSYSLKKRALLTLGLLVSLFAAQIILTEAIHLYLGRQTSIVAVAVEFFRAMFADRNVMTSSLFYPIIYASMRLIGGKPGWARMGAASAVFIILSVGSLYVIQYLDMDGGGVNFSLKVAGTNDAFVPRGTEISFFTDPASPMENTSAFTVTKSETAGMYRIVWGISEAPLTGDELVSISGTPAGRLLTLANCPPKLSHPAAYNFTLYDYQGSKSFRYGDLVAVKQEGWRNHYSTKVKVCSPNDLILIMNVLSEKDGLFIIS